MDDYETRKQLGNQVINQLINDGITDSFKQAIILWKDGYSLRIIQDLTDIHRSKLSRYINEHNLTRDDDIRTQNRKNRVYQCEKLYKMGFSPNEIAQEMCMNPRTIDSYLKEIGVKSKTRMTDFSKK